MRYNEHYCKADRNLNFYNIFDIEKKDEYKDWMITILFYLTLHYIDEYLARVHGIIEIRAQNRMTQHSVRARHVADHIPEFHEKFRELLDLSRDARYNNTIETTMNWDDIKSNYEDWVFTECKGLQKMMN